MAHRKVYGAAKRVESRAPGGGIAHERKRPATGQTGTELEGYAPWLAA